MVAHSMLATDSEFAGYRIEAVAGEGGMGIVYRAMQLKLGRPVALKLIAEDLANDPGFRARFERECEIAASIDHPNVIPVYEAGEAEGHLFIAMRYVDGTDLGELLRREGKLAPPRAVRLVAQVAAALDAAHRSGLVHRDIKPGNVLIAGEGEEEHAYLTDFGLTKRQSSISAHTKTGMFVGTLDYAAPEQIRGERPDARTDVYALGCVLYQLLTGEAPFVRDLDVARMNAHLNDPPPAVTEALPSAPPGLDAVVATAMAKDPDDRFPTAGDIGRAAREALSGAPAVPAKHKRSKASAPPGAPVPEGDEKRGLRVALGIALPTILVLGLIAAGLAAAGVFGGGDDDGGETPAKPAAAAPTAAAREATAAPTAAEGSAPGAAAAASIEVGGAPDGVSVDGATVWVANSRDGTLSRIDASTNETVGEPVDVGKDPDSVAAGKGVVWVSNAGANTVQRIKGAVNPVPEGSIDVGSNPEGISIGKQLVWVANTRDGTVNRIDRASPSVVGAPIGVGSRPVGIFVGEGTVWVTNSGDGTVSRIDPSTAEVVGEPIDVGDTPRGVVEGLGSVWVANSGDGTVTRLNPGTGAAIGEPIKVGENPREVAVGAGSVWVTNFDSNSVSRIDPDTGRVLGQPIPTGDRPLGVAVSGNAVFVANFGDDSVTRIDVEE